MWKVFLLYLSANILLVLAESPIDSDYELDFFINSNDDELPSARFEPLGINEKVFAIVATAQVNWFAAQQICSYRGLTLASIRTAQESEDLRRYLYDNGLDAGKNFWLSGTDLSSTDNWTWFSTGRPLVFDNFARDVPYNPPADAASDGNASEYRCMLLRPDGRWIKERCDTPAYFICENRCSLSSYTTPL